MTSANVTKYNIYKNGRKVGQHYQSHLCKTHWEDLEKFSPPEDFEIMAYGYDEEEEYWEDKKINLKKFLNKISEAKRKSDESIERFRADKLSMDEKSFREKYNLIN